jgi:uncharacterized membrane protein YeaQ/YmgE (transglycosylase-associated protein family)
MGDIIVLFILGLLLGWAARLLHPAKLKMSLLISALLGLFACIITQIGIPLGFYKKGDVLSYTLCIFITIFIIWLYGYIQSKRK